MKNKLKASKKILIAPLNWGLGHATRCIPIINALIIEGFTPIIAGDGDSLKLLQKEFPKLQSFTLPSYHIQYAKNGKNLKFKLLFDIPRIIKIVKLEKQVVADIIEKENIIGIISDNRFGVRSSKIPSVYITHQIDVASGATSWITSKIHQNIIVKFDVCWVPDYKDEDNLAGKLSHTNATKLRLKYIHPLSRFDESNAFVEMPTGNKKYDFMVLLSGPEPQRSLLEKKLLKQLKSTSKKVLFVRGVISDKENEKLVVGNKNMIIVNYMLQDDLQKAINESEFIITRSGYSTIMDLERLKAKAFFIPTPGQYEQEYLAKYFEKKNIAPYSKQADFSFKMLEELENYDGFTRKKIKKIKPFPFFIFNS